MAGFSIGGKQILGAKLGNQILYKAPKYDSTWLDCKDVTKLDENSGNKFNSGSSTIMKYDAENHTGLFKTDLVLLSQITVTNGPDTATKVPVCMLQLPDGFVFGSGTGSKLSNIRVWSSTNGTTSTINNNLELFLTYADDRMYIKPNINATSYVFNVSLINRAVINITGNFVDNTVPPFGGALKLPGIYQL